MRKIPATMATQHPDNATAPYWDDQAHPFIGVHKEIAEAVHCFQDLGVNEFMWDWEGKHADATVVDRLLSEYHDYFVDQQLGRDKFLTFRIPNIWEEKGYNLMQAMSVILSGQDVTRDLQIHDRPLFEVILPMTESADQLMHMHSLFEKLARFKSTDFTADQAANTDYLELIPLVESVESQQDAVRLLTEYVTLHKLQFGHQPRYIRPFMACSDSALTSGFLAGVIGNKVGLARLYEFQDKTGIPVFPIFGSGSLPFRGGLAPATIDRFIEEFPGVRTVTIQSAFRYDNPLTEVQTAIAHLEATLPHIQPRIITPTAQKHLIKIGAQSTAFYTQTVHQLAGPMRGFFDAIPKRRDRRQHIGLLAYARSMGSESLPRAITFTAGFYSLGIPPEFIGLGRTLQALSPAGRDLLASEYPSIKADIGQAGRFLNAENLARLAVKNPVWQEIQADVAGAAKVLGLHFGPVTDQEKAHYELSTRALQSQKKHAELTKLIDGMAHLRRSLG